jgi:hypothetical protein
VDILPDVEGICEATGAEFFIARIAMAGNAAISRGPLTS